MGWSIVARIVHVHKGPIHNRHRLQEISQHFTQVVAILERRNCRQDNIHFNKQLIASVVGAQILNLSDCSCEAHGKVEKEITLIRLRRETGEVAHMMGGCLAPCENHDQGEEETSCGVEPPNSSVEADWNCKYHDYNENPNKRRDIPMGKKMEPMLKMTSVFASSALEGAC